MSNPTKTAERLHVENLVASEHARVKREQAILDRKAMQTQTKAKEKAGHTPGPWKVDPAMPTQIAHDFSTVAEAAMTYGLQIAIANARLIAAAPELAAELAETKAQRDELLEALKELVGVEFRHGSQAERDNAWTLAQYNARTAIAKATEAKP